MVDGLLLKLETAQAAGGLKVAHDYCLNGERLTAYRRCETRALDLVDQCERRLAGGGRRYQRSQ